MNYAEAIELLYAQLPMFSRIGAAAYKKDLDNTLALCSLLDNPQEKFKTIHVAGTNGKGSVSHMLAAIFQQAGYKTGLYTSPHLQDFRERIKINGVMCSEEFVCEFTERLLPDMQQIEPSFFELTVAMAFEYFASQQVDIAIIETGLGGRLDSTNVIKPEISVITNIGWDHMNLLGNTLQEIATEKAGIIKANTPVVIGEIMPETEPVFMAVAKEKTAPIFFAEQNYQYLLQDWSTDGNATFTIQNNNLKCAYNTDLPGIYQAKNICTVLCAADVLNQLGWKLEKVAVSHAVAHTKALTGLHGRWEQVHKNPPVVLDVAHNEAGMRQVLLHLQHIPYQQLHIVMGMVKDKAIDAVLSLMPPNAIYYFTKAHIPRALDEAALKQQASACNLKGNCYEDVNAALQVVLNNASGKDFVLVCGSVFLVGEVNREAIKKPHNNSEASC